MRKLTDSLMRHDVLRLAFPVGSNLYVTRHPTTGVLSGLSIDLGNELAARLAKPIKYQPYDSIGALITASSQDGWDLSTIIIDPARRELFNYTNPYIEADATYIVRSETSIHSVTDVDRPEIRTGVAENSAFDLFLRREKIGRVLIRYNNIATALRSFEMREIDAVAGPRHLLLAAQRRLPGSIVLQDRFDLMRVGIAVLKDRPLSAVALLNEYLAELIASGWMTNAVKRADMSGVRVSQGT